MKKVQCTTCMYGRMNTRCSRGHKQVEYSGHWRKCELYKPKSSNARDQLRYPEREAEIIPSLSLDELSEWIDDIIWYHEERKAAVRFKLNTPLAVKEAACKTIAASFSTEKEEAA